MSSLYVFAHAGEVHESSAESSLHLLETWYVALLVFIIASYVVGTVTYMLSKKSLPKTLLVLMGVYLVGGIATYEISPVISILSILCGFIIALGMTFTALMVPLQKK